MKSWSKPEGNSSALRQTESRLSLTHESVAQNVLVCCLEPVNRISHPDNGPGSKKRTHGDLGTLQKRFPIGAKLKNATFYCCLRQLQHENRRKFTRQAAGEKQAVKTCTWYICLFSKQSCCTHATNNITAAWEPESPESCYLKNNLPAWLLAKPLYIQHIHATAKCFRPLWCWEYNSTEW